MSDLAGAGAGVSLSGLILSPGEVHVWVVPLDDPDKKQRRSQAHLARDRLLAAYLGCDPDALRFERGAFGKPRVLGRAGRVGAAAPRPPDPHSLEFNMSHSGAVALVAVARGLALGVDVQEPHRVTGEPWFAGRICTRRERARLGPSPSASELLRLWVRKEATIKARGDLSYVSAGDVDVLEDRVDGGWRCIDLQIPGAPGCHAALAFDDRPHATVAVRVRPYDGLGSASVPE